jgi:hypothetical protein
MSNTIYVQPPKSQGLLCMEPLSDSEPLREAELEALRMKITEEEPGYWDRLAIRIIAEAKAEGGSITMEELLGMPPAEEDQQRHERTSRQAGPG